MEETKKVFKNYLLQNYFHRKSGDFVASDNLGNIGVSMDENLKKALTELLILHLLNKKEYYIGELTAALAENSGGILKIVFPYSAVYRLQRDECINETERRIAPDGRRRQFYSITPTGRAYYKKLLNVYRTFSEGVENILKK